jgi:hypothetical protein
MQRRGYSDHVVNESGIIEKQEKFFKIKILLLNEDGDMCNTTAFACPCCGTIKIKFKE